MRISRHTDVWTSVCVGGGYHVDSATLSPSGSKRAAEAGDDVRVFPARPTGPRTPCAQAQWADDLGR